MPPFSPFFFLSQAEKSSSSLEIGGRPCYSIRYTDNRIQVVDDMADALRYFVVEADALPEVFRHVMHAKELLASGAAKSAAQAARMAGISRSAFYKYKDAVFTYNERGADRIITLHLVLQDRPGVLAPVIAAFYQAGANILTLNQNIPVSGAAPVSISASTDGMKGSMEELLSSVRAIEGVQSIENISGNPNQVQNAQSNR